MNYGWGYEKKGKTETSEKYLKMQRFPLKVTPPPSIAMWANPISWVEWLTPSTLPRLFHTDKMLKLRVTSKTDIVSYLTRSISTVKAYIIRRHWQHGSRFLFQHQISPQFLQHYLKNLARPLSRWIFEWNVTRCYTRGAAFCVGWRLWQGLCCSNLNWTERGSSHSVQTAMKS